MWRNGQSRHLSLGFYLFCFLVAGVMGVCFAPGTASGATSVKQFGITWTFDANYTTGQFANGDYWVIGPVTIIGITPASTVTEGRTKNGSMLDPTWQDSYVEAGSHQGLDSAIGGWDSTKNVARPDGNDLSAGNPLVIEPNHSLLSVISVDAVTRYQLSDAAILTILGSAPEPNSFRPPYSGTDKTIKYNVSDLDYSSLSTLTPVASAPNLATAEGWFERPWLSFHYYMDCVHPVNNMPGRNDLFAERIGEGALVLNLNYTNAQKKTLMIRFVQVGIDLYGILANDGRRIWTANGAQSQGRKMPILFAGTVLNDPNMKAIGSKSGDYLYSKGYEPADEPTDYLHFAEDDQIFSVIAQDVFSPPYTLQGCYMGSGKGTSAGNVKVVHDSNVVVGIGTSWLGLTYYSTVVHQSADPHYFYFGVEKDNKAYYTSLTQYSAGYVIKSIDSDTQITLTTPYQGDTNETGNAKYAIAGQIFYGHGLPGVGLTQGFDYSEYLSANVGLPEWGINHESIRYKDGLDWAANYRVNVGRAGLGSHQLTALIMGLKTLWNHDVYFDYIDRYMQIMVGQSGRSLSVFSADMWDAYRANYGNVWTPDSNNSAPILASIGNKTVNENTLLTFTINAADPDGDTVTYSYSVLPAGATFSSPFRWTPGYDQAGTYNVTFVATDEHGAQSSPQTVTITVNNVNRPPVLAAIGNKSVDENALLTFTISATDPDGGTITYSALNRPTGATFSGSTFKWTPGYNQAGSYQVTFIASDGKSQDSEIVTITVNNVNRAPVLAAISNKSVNENSALSFSVSATDPDGDTVTYSASGLPTGATFSGQTFSWTPGYDKAGTYNVDFIARDGYGAQSSPRTVTITVNNVNRPPVLSSIGNKSVYQNELLNFTVIATDPDGSVVTYSASGLPAGATFVGSTFNWQPSSTQVGNYQVTFIARDGALQDSETITVTVLRADKAAPVVTNCLPAAGAIQVPLNTLITLHVTDAGKGVNAASVTIKVDDDIVYSGDTPAYNSSRGTCRRTGTPADYAFVYQANEMFDFDQPVTVLVNAADIAGNVMSQYSYSFKTEMWSFGQNKKVNLGSDTLIKGTPQTVTDSSGNIWAVWHAGAVGSRDIYIDKLPVGDDNFGNMLKLISSSADQCNPAIAVGSDDKLYVVWQDNRRGNWDIYASVSADGITWSTGTLVTDSNDNQINPAIAIDNLSPNRAHVVWQDDRNGNQDIFIATSSNSFLTETVSQITFNVADQTEPAIAADSSNKVYVVWTDGRNGSSDIYGGSSSSGPWTNVPFVNSAGNQSSPAIAAESSGSILHLLWVDDRSGNQDIYYASSNGLPGSPVNGSSIIDDTSGANQLSPVIITNGGTGNDLKVFACWQDRRNVIAGSSDTDIYFTEITSSSRTNVLVGDDDTNSDQDEPVMGIDMYGHPYLMWADARSANTEIYYAGSTFVEPVALAAKEVPALSGAVVGTDPAAITSVDDVSVVVPSGVYPCDVRITISKVKNPQAFATPCLGSYDFGPSGMQFSQPVTVTIPYPAPSSGSSALAYWYNSLTGALSQQGITDVENIQISYSLYALRFKTTHFTPFYLLGGSTEGGGGGGGGGCSISPSGECSIIEFFLPYIGLAIVMAIVKLRDKRNQKVNNIPESKR
jgi:hypothetical protein